MWRQTLQFSTPPASQEILDSKQPISEPYLICSERRPCSQPPNLTPTAATW
jgi:hypothetical protein